MNWEDIAHNFYSFNFDELWFIIQNVFHLGTSPIWTWDNVSSAAVGEFCRCQLDQTDGHWHFNYGLMIVCLLGFWVTDKDKLGSVTREGVFLFLWVFRSSVSFYLMYFYSLVFSRYKSTLDVSSWGIVPFNIVYCPYLLLIIFFIVKTDLAEINTSTLDLFWLVLA